ncbi:hypothetical protein G5I_02104 [Acromyrmex echinatior]|uniref:Uncharacterized protein n=1 Tax=Acromyrmex echinatior TaxID=103372 RepID=F4W9F2_ACREC|nr:hypothetical protein G5I_02104 [Acromyrmex echinatior]
MEMMMRRLEKYMYKEKLKVNVEKSKKTEQQKEHIRETMRKAIVIMTGVWRIGRSRFEENLKMNRKYNAIWSRTSGKTVEERKGGGNEIVEELVEKD